MVDRAVKRQSVGSDEASGHARLEGPERRQPENLVRQKTEAVNQYLFGRQLGPPDTPPDREFWAAGPRQGQNQYLFWAN